MARTIGPRPIKAMILHTQTSGLQLVNFEQYMLRRLQRGEKLRKLLRERREV